MNTTLVTPPNNGTAAHRIEFFRLPAPGKRDPHFGLSRGWYYKAAAAGEIKMAAIRNRGAVRGVRLVAYDSVLAYIRRSMGHTVQKNAAGDALPAIPAGELPLFSPVQP